jgi:polysaccharide biosynthesis/export protein
MKTFLFSLLIIIIFCMPGYTQGLGTAKMHYELGQMYYELGLYKEAEIEFEKALSESSDIPASSDLVSPVSISVALEPDKTVILTDVTQEKESRTGYMIDEGDKLFVRVWENEDLTQEAIVRPDGKISFPLIDEVQAQGLTISELDKEMTDKLKEYIRFPDVSISLMEIGGSKIIVLGEVQEPGVYNVSGHKTILEAIAMAQGFTADSIASSVVLVEGGLANPRGRRLDLNRALHNPQSRENVVLKSNDIVFVPKKFIADINYVIRQILQPFSSGAREARTFGKGS